MQIIENSIVKEKVYIEKLENGMTFMFTHYGSNDNQFIVPGETEVTEVPNGVAHFLEHKMFEQENKPNSLDVLSALGVEANAYTTNDHTAYLFECTDNFYEALDELMDYFQHPYFTDQNVEKEKGIIDQEIRMYEDYPEMKVYMNALEDMYQKHPIRIDIAGTSQTIRDINKEILYKCYNTFYHPSNTAMVICGDFEFDEILSEVKKRLLPRERQTEIKRITTEEPITINQKESLQKMEVSNPIFVIGYKDQKPDKDIVRKQISIQILLGIIIGKSSKLYQKLYEENIVKSEIEYDYEFSDEYAHVIITGYSKDPKRLETELKKEVEELINNGIDENDFERNKKKLYGDYIRSFDEVSEVSRNFLVNFFKGLNFFDYLEEYENISKEYTENILKDVFKEEKEILSVIEK